VSQQPERARTQPYTVDQAAEKAGVNKKTVRKGIDDGTIKAIRFGRRVLIPRVPFDRLVDEGEIN
jgi:excisionase family DNA binding protein